MTQHMVTWSVDVFDATTPEEAARKALAMIQDPASIAHVFEVAEVRCAGGIFRAEMTSVTVDLDEIDRGEVPS